MLEWTAVSGLQAEERAKGSRLPFITRAWLLALLFLPAAQPYLRSAK